MAGPCMPAASACSKSARALEKSSASNAAWAAANVASAESSDQLGAAMHAHAMAAKAAHRCAFTRVAGVRVHRRGRGPVRVRDPGGRAWGLALAPGPDPVAGRAAACWEVRREADAPAADAPAAWTQVVWDREAWDR